MASPQSKKDVQQFLGMLLYLSQFIPQLADKTHTLRSLINTDQQASFDALKRTISEDACLKYYDRVPQWSKSQKLPEMAWSCTGTEWKISGVWIKDTNRVSIKIQQHRARDARSGVCDTEISHLPVSQAVHHNH